MDADRSKERNWQAGWKWLKNEEEETVLPQRRVSEKLEIGNKRGDLIRPGPKKPRNGEISGGDPSSSSQCSKSHRPRLLLLAQNGIGRRRLLGVTKSLTFQKLEVHKWGIEALQSHWLTPDATFRLLLLDCLITLDYSLPFCASATNAPKPQIHSAIMFIVPVPHFIRR